MQYRFIDNINFEDFACGRVLYHKAGLTNYPVRLASEIFMRCLEAINNPDKKVCVYDPCCGSAYLLTILGFRYGDKIESLYGSDVSENAVNLAKNNLNLLTRDGLLHRKEELETMYKMHGKVSHLEALKSTTNLLGLINKPVCYEIYLRDILNPKEKPFLNPLADIIFTDVPYGNLVSWSTGELFNIDKMLDNIIGNLNDNAVVAISSDKQQKIKNSQYQRIKRIQIGKRKIEILGKA